MEDRLLIKNAIVGNQSTDLLIDTASGKIVYVGKVQCPSVCKSIDAAGKVAVPGFVNMHTHAAMTLTRGVEEDLPLESWLRKVWKVESNLDEDMIYWGTKLACLEMIQSGTTSFNDHYWMPQVAVRAVQEMGIRSWNSYVCMDHFDKDAAARDREGLEKAYEQSLSWGGLSTFVAGCHSVYSVSEENLVWCNDFALSHGLRLQIHLAETEYEVRSCRSRYGLSPVGLLDRLGMLGPHLIAAHTLWLDETDIELLGRNRVNVVHNINSNLKIASGYRFMYDELRDAGANVTIGTDGCASSNNLDVLEAMKTAAMVQKAWRGNPKALPLGELMDIATVNGCRALGLDGGCLREGMVADILLIDINRAAFVPNINFLSNLVYAAHSDCIDTVICNGRIVMHGRQVAQEQTILSEASRAAGRLMERSGIAMEGF